MTSGPTSKGIEGRMRRLRHPGTVNGVPARVKKTRKTRFRAKKLDFSRKELSLRSGRRGTAFNRCKDAAAISRTRDGTMKL